MVRKARTKVVRRRRMTILHGLKHHSPSALNLAAAALPLYFLEKVMGKKGAPSAAMFRGIAAEDGIVHGLKNPTCSVKECQDLALAKFDELLPAKKAIGGFATVFATDDPKRGKERDAIPGLVEQGLIALRPYGVPSNTQRKVMHKIDGLKLPILGFLDVEWEQHGIVIDIKTQLALTSEASEPHRRQVAFYVHNTNSEPRLAYMTPKKHGVYRVDNPSEDMRGLIRIGQTIERFLSLSTDPAELAALLIVDTTSFYYNDPGIRSVVKEVFGY